MADTITPELLDRLKALGAAGRETADRLDELSQKQLEYVEAQMAGQADWENAISAASERLRDQLKDLEKTRRELVAINKEGMSRVELVEHQTKLDENLLELAEAKTRAGKTLTEEEKKRLAELKKIEKTQRSILEVLKEQYKASSDLAKNFQISQDMSAHTHFNMDKMESALKSMSESKGMGLLAGAAGILEGAFKQVMNTMISTVFGLETMESEFRKATGASAAFASEITDVYEATRELNVTAHLASGAYQALRKTYTDFTFQSEGQRKEIGKTITMLQQHGIGAQEAAQGMQIATKSFGMSGTAAAKNAMELNALAKEIGVAPQEIAGQFANLGGQLSKLGSDGIRAFKGLARVSKITGMEMGKLIAMTEKFDTFESAAEMAGNLNAALGGNFVNAMDMMMETDPVERFETLRNTLLDTGLSFDNMSYYQRKFYTQSLGLSDVGDLAQMMSGNYNSLDDSIGKVSADYEEQAELAKDMLDVTTELKMALIKLVDVMKPWIAKIRDITTALTEFLEGPAGQVLLWVGGILFAIKGLTLVITGFATVLSPIAGILGLTGTAAAGATAPLTGMVGAMNTASLGTVAFGLAMLLVGAGVGAAALGIAQIVKAFSGLGDAAWPAAAAVAFFGAAFVATVWLMSSASVAALTAAIAVGGLATAVFQLGLALAGVALVWGGLSMAFDWLRGKKDETAKFDAINSAADKMAEKKEAMASIAVSFETIAKAMAEGAQHAWKWSNMFSAITGMHAVFGQETTAIAIGANAVATAGQSSPTERAPAGAPAGAGAAGAGAPAAAAASQTYNLEIPIYIASEEIDKKVIRIVDGRIDQKTQEALGLGFSLQLPGR